MYSAEALLDLHERGQRSLRKLLGHCEALAEEELNRELAGFSYPTVRLQFHHEIGAEEYWIGVLRGKLDADDDDAAYPTIASLEKYRTKVCAATQAYLRAASPEELSTVRAMVTWGGNEQRLMPARVIARTLTHLYQHQGEIMTMCRLLGKRAERMDFPIV